MRTMNRSWLVPCLIASTFGVAEARDLWTEGGMVILAEENVVVLSRAQRHSPDTRLEPVTSLVSEAVTAVLADETPIETQGNDLFADEGSVFEVPVSDEAAALTRPLTAPDVPETAEASGPIDPATEQQSAEDTGEPSEIDVSGVVMLGDAARVDPKAPSGLVAGEDDEFDLAALPPQPDPTLAPRPGQQETANSGSTFDSRAFRGTFSGIGGGEGMRLELATLGMELDGWFVDSAGQVFEVDGEFTSLEGDAQAAIVNAGQMVGFMELHLTNLGLSALYIPLMDGEPMITAARQYEFLRALSGEAQSGIENSRSQREEEMNRPQNEGLHNGPLQMRFPGDD